jgi:hypothetical protein
MAFCLGTPKEESQNCPVWTPRTLWVHNFLLRPLIGWGLKQTCSSPWELSNGVLHSTCTHRGRVDSQLLVVGSQIASLTPDPSFCHNLCCRCPNGSCEAIFDMYTLITFQWYEKHLKVRCFDTYNQTLKFWESRRTPKSPFRECECHHHTLPKVGLRQITYKRKIYSHIQNLHCQFFNYSCCHNL